MTTTTRPQPDRLRHALLSQITSQVFRLIVALVIGGWLARYLGPRAFGQLSYVLALIGLLGPLGSLGLKGALAALLCEATPLPGLVSTAFFLELLGTGLLSLCLLPWVWTAADPVIPGLIALGVAANLFNSAEVYETDLLNRHRGTVVGRVSFVKVLSGALFTVVALVVKAPLLVFGGVQTLQNALGALVVVRAAGAAGVRRLIADLNGPAATALLRRGGPLMVASLATMVYMKSDQVMLEWLRGSESVGQYSIAIRLAEALYFLPVILVDTVFPRIANVSESAVAEQQLRRLYRWTWLLGMALMMGSVLVLPLLIPLIFGPQYIDASAALVCLGPANLAACTGCASGAWLNANGRQGLYAQRSAIGAVSNVALNLVMIPAYGIVGAAIATSLAQLTSVYLFPLLMRSTRANTRLLLCPW